jgi:hypothetical protein
MLILPGGGKKHLTGSQASLFAFVQTAVDKPRRYILKESAAIQRGVGFG